MFVASVPKEYVLMLNLLSTFRSLVVDIAVPRKSSYEQHGPPFLS